VEKVGRCSATGRGGVESKGEGGAPRGAVSLQVSHTAGCAVCGRCLMFVPAPPVQTRRASWQGAGAPGGVR